MRTLLLLTALAAIGCADPKPNRSDKAAEGSAAEAHGSIEKDSVRRLVSEWHRIYLAQDTGAARRLLADTYIATGPMGDTARKAETVSELAAPLGPDRIDSLELQDPPKIQLVGDSAVATGLMTVRGVQHGQAFAHVAEYTYGFLRGSTGWQLRSSAVKHAGAQ
jgi:ketosteroid isomerase-like protein